MFVLEYDTFYNSLENLCKNHGHCSAGYNCKRFWKQHIGLCVPGKE